MKSKPVSNTLTAEMVFTGWKWCAAAGAERRDNPAELRTADAAEQGKLVEIFLPATDQTAGGKEQLFYSLQKRQFTHRPGEKAAGLESVCP